MAVFMVFLKLVKLAFEVSEAPLSVDYNALKHPGSFYLGVTTYSSKIIFSVVADVLAVRW